jgi:ribosomal-protein-serine acetyltransferase
MLKEFLRHPWRKKQIRDVGLNNFLGAGMLENRLTESISIKMIELRHSKAFYEFIDKNRKYLEDWIPFVSKTKKCEDIAQYIKNYLEKHMNGLGFLYGLWDGDRIIGTILAREIDAEAKWAEIGYMIDENYQGKGLIKEACTRLIKYLFTDLEMEKIEICCDENNKSSRALAEKLGFAVEGTIRNHMLVNNKIGNMMYYGLLKYESPI